MGQQASGLKNWFMKLDVQEVQWIAAQDKNWENRVPTPADFVTFTCMQITLCKGMNLYVQRKFMVVVS